jgi:hypothetical protein
MYVGGIGSGVSSSGKDGSGFVMDSCGRVGGVLSSPLGPSWAAATTISSSNAGSKQPTIKPLHSSFPIFFMHFTPSDGNTALSRNLSDHNGISET